MSPSRDKEVMVKMASLGIFPLWGQASILQLAGVGAHIEMQAVRLSLHS